MVVLVIFDQFGDLISQKVNRIFVHKNRPVIEVDGLKLTKEHPFLMPDGSWKTMGELKIGDSIVRADGSPSLIKTYRELSKTATVYNITVDNLHTYIAGGFRVHNKDL